MTNDTRLAALALLTASLLAPLAVSAAPPKERAAPPSVKSFAAPYPTFGSIDRLDPALDAILAPEAKLEKLAEGFDWSEGPVWVKKGKFLLFSDIPPNTIYRWKPGKGVTTFMQPSGYHGDRKDMAEPGTNGLVVDSKGNLLMCAHGDRRLARLKSWNDPHGEQITLADRYDGKRLNSPNDMVIHSSGDIFFTDPPYGLAKRMDDKEKELPWQGVYRLDTKGKVHLLHDKLERPNGIALSPDEKTLYVANSHDARPIWMAFDVKADRTLGNERVFFDARDHMARTKRTGMPDGMAVDRKGNVFATGPGGVLIFSPDARHLGTILTGQATANCKFGEDGRTLFITADMFLGRIKTKSQGLGF